MTPGSTPQHLPEPGPSDGGPMLTVAACGFYADLGTSQHRALMAEWWADYQAGELAGYCRACTRRLEVFL